MKTFDAKSELKLQGCHPDLQKVARRAQEFFPNGSVEVFITCGRRTVEQQRALYQNGFSRTMKSRHIPDESGYSYAVDFAVKLDGALRWDWPIFNKIAVAMKKAAKIENVPIEWGGDWKSFEDGPHFQLPRKKYPAKGEMFMAGIASFDEPESDVLPGMQEAAFMGAVKKPVNLNAIWTGVSTVGGSIMAMIHGIEWQSVAVICAFVAIGAIGYFLLRDRLPAVTFGGDDANTI
jgi:hypothetical protein